jgi:hypothetical protein
MINKLRLLVGVGMCVALCGCVIGSGPCLWLQVRHDFTGHIHFREFPRSDGVDTVPILILDKTGQDRGEITCHRRRQNSRRRSARPIHALRHSSERHIAAAGAGAGALSTHRFP